MQLLRAFTVLAMHANKPPMSAHANTEQARAARAKCLVVMFEMYFKGEDACQQDNIRERSSLQELWRVITMWTFT